MNRDRHAYLILAHALPSQVRKLLVLLDDPRNDLYVHIDRKAGFGPDAFEGCCRRSARGAGKKSVSKKASRDRKIDFFISASLDEREKER